MSHQCGTCGFTGESLSMCGGCNRQAYCSKACQKRDWKKHKQCCLLPECPICFELIDKVNSLTTECGHTFHTSCLMKNVAHNGFGCPYCRKAMAEIVQDTEMPELISENIFETGWGTEEPGWDSEEPNQWTVEPVWESEAWISEPLAENRETRLRVKPTVEEITQKLADQGITMRHFVQAFLKDHGAYDEEEPDFMRVDDELYEIIEEIIENAQH